MNSRRGGLVIKLSLAEPLWLVLLIPVWALLMLAYHRRGGAVQVPQLAGLAKLARSRWAWMRHAGLVLRLLALSLLVLALARPQAGRSHSKQRSEGFDMMLVVDTSKSMTAMDFVVAGRRQNRLQVAKKVLAEFIRNRPDDRLGLTLFGTYAFAYVPLTLDHDVLLRYLDEVEIGMAGDSTAIGDAIGVGTNRIKDIPAKSKIMILLTDGANQAGKADPREAAKAAQTMGVRIYTVGIGSNDLVPIPTPLGYRNARFELDEELLRDIAAITDGRYFKASDTETLVKIYETIDQLEKAKVHVDVFRQYDEKFAIFLWPALLLLMAELFFRTTRFRRLP